jgi:N utilization substance protein A
VFSDPESKTIQAVVDEDQLSLAIGRNGQNVRLASELTAWKIDLYSSREWLERGGEGPLFAPLPSGTEAENESMAAVPLAELEGLSPELVAILEGAGLSTLDSVLDLEREDLARVPGMTEESTEQLMTFLTELTDDEEPRAGK